MEDSIRLAASFIVTVIAGNALFRIIEMLIEPPDEGVFSPD